MQPPGGRLKTPELIERSAQLADLGKHLADVVETSRGALVAVGGEAGAGKTALVGSFCDRAGKDARVIHGACYPLSTARPLGPFADIALVSAPVKSAIDAGGKPHEVAAALLSETSARRLVIVVLEDLQWADEASLDVLRVIAGRIAAVRMLVVAIYRDDELDRLHPLRILLGDLPTNVARLTVPPLSGRGVAALARRVGQRVDADGGELYRKTGGNPFFVSEVLASPQAEIPDTVRDAVLARVARLAPGAMALLDAISVAPGGADISLLEAIAPDSLGELDVCVTSGVVTVERDVARFRHELARIAVEESMPALRRRELHRAALRTIAEPGARPRDLEALSHHAESAGDHEAVLRYAPQAAAHAAALGAHREAEAQYARALVHKALMKPAERASVLASHAQECYLRNMGADAIASGTEAVFIYHELGDKLREADTLCMLSTIQRINGRLSDAEHEVAEALKLLKGLPAGRELGRAHACAAQIAMCQGDVTRTYAEGESALSIAEQVNDRETIAHTLITLGTIEAEDDSIDGFDSGIAKLERGVAIARESGFDELVGRGYNNLCYEAFAKRRLDLVDRYVSECIGYCTDRGLQLWLNTALGSKAELELFRGNWDAAVESAHRALAEPGTTLPRLGPLTVLGLVRGRRGDPDAWGPLDEALAIADAAGELQMLVAVASARAELAWLEGDPQRMVDETQRIVEWAVRDGAAYALKDISYWRRKAGLIELQPAGDDSPRVAQRSGDSASAALRWADLGYVYDAALAMADEGTERSLREALATFQRLGARAAAAVAARSLRQLGARGVPRGPRPATASHRAGLTPREVEIGGLLAQGLRDAEIASRLFLSVKTVGHHVSSILHKLGVRSRAEAGAVLAAQR